MLEDACSEFHAKPGNPEARRDMTIAEAKAEAAAAARRTKNEKRRARMFRQPTAVLCDCASGMPVLTHSRVCASCEAHNAAVAAQRAAAESFAKARCKGHVPGGAWLNRFGCFATTKEHHGILVASPKEVAPFVELTERARDAAKRGAL